MNTYCEILPNNNFSIQEIKPETLKRLLALLNDVNHPDFAQLKTAIDSKLAAHIPPFFAQRNQEIFFCKKCSAVGYFKNVPNNLSAEFTVEPCPTCNGEGSRVKQVFVSYEAINPNKRKRYAANDFKNTSSLT